MACPWSKITHSLLIATPEGIGASLAVGKQCCWVIRNVTDSTPLVVKCVEPGANSEAQGKCVGDGKGSDSDVPRRRSGGLHSLDHRTRSRLGAVVGRRLRTFAPSRVAPNSRNVCIKYEVVLSLFSRRCLFVLHLTSLSLDLKAADEAFQVERKRVVVVDSLAQVLDVSSDLVNSRLLISQVPVGV